MPEYTEVESVKVRYFHKLNGDIRHTYIRLQELSQGDQFRADDESPFVVWEVMSDPYLNKDDVWCLQARCIAG